MSEDTQDPRFQAYLTYRAGATKGAGEQLKTYDYREMIPFAGAGFTAKNAYDTYRAAQAWGQGTATKEQALMLADAQRESTFGADVLGITQGMVGYAGDIALSGGVGAGVRAGVGKLAPKIAAKMGTGIGKVATTLGSLEGVVRPAQEALLPEGGRVSATAARMATELGMDDAGQILAHVEDPGDFRIRALMDTAIEDVSEFTGGLVGGPAAKLAMKTAIGKWWAKKTGGTVADFFRKTADRVAFNNIAGEYFEEIVGAAARGATSGLPEEYKLAESPMDAFPNLRESAAMIAAFSIFPMAAGGVSMASNALTGKRKAEDAGTGETTEYTPDAGLEAFSGADEVGAKEEIAPEVSPEPVAGQEVVTTPPPVTPAEEVPTPPGAPAPTEAGERGREGVPPTAEEVPDSATDPAAAPAAPIRVGEREYEEVPQEAYTPEIQRAARVASRLGTRARFTETEDFGGVSVVPGEAVLSSKLPGPELVRKAYHEAGVHDVSRRVGGVEELHSRIRRADAQGLRIASRRKLARLRASGGPALQAAQDAPRAIRKEETLATLAEDSSAYLELLASPEGARHIRRLVRTDRGLVEHILDWLRSMSAKVFGGDARTRYERDIEEATRALRRLDPGAEPANATALKVAELLREWMDAGARAEAGETAGLDPRFADVWHGTGADLGPGDEFRDDKIGTGEGAQVYGWGHYMGGVRDVAEHYRAQNTNESPANRVQVDGVDLGEFLAGAPNHHIGAVGAALERNGLDPEAALENVPFGESHTEPLLRRVVGRAVTRERKGSTLKVTLAPRESSYLLWDKPLSEQSEEVQAALERLESGGNFDMPGRWREAGTPATGGQWYRAYQAQLVQAGMPRKDAAEATSKDLLSEGVRGNKYLDQGSRAAGEGTYNYVVFDPADAKIEARFAPMPDLKHGDARKAWALLERAESEESEVKHRILYHSGVADPEIIRREGIEPRFGDWVEEVLAGATDERIDPEEAFVPVSFYDRMPQWLRTQVGRKLGKSYDEVTRDDIRKHGYLAVVDNDDGDGEAEHAVYRVVDSQGEDSRVETPDGKEVRLYETELYEEGMFGERKAPFGMEPGDFVTAEWIEPNVLLTGDALLEFMDAYKANVEPDIRFAPMPPGGVDSAAFSKWFGDSKVVDAEGRPLRVYKGGSEHPEDVTVAFDESDWNTMGASFFTSNYDVAETYAMSEGGGVSEVYLSLQNPDEVNVEGATWDDLGGFAYMIRVAKDNGHDGLIVRNVRDDASGGGDLGTNYVAFRPTQIKSATGNQGTYSPTDPDIRYSPAPPYFSAIERGIEGLKQKRFTAGQLDGMVKKIPGVTEEELAWIDWEEFLAGRKNVTKEEALEWVRAHQVEVREKVLGEADPSVFPFMVYRQKVKRRGDLEGAQPEMEYVPAPNFGRFRTRVEAKAAVARGEDPDLDQGQSDAFAATHFDQQARNWGHYKIRRDLETVVEAGRARTLDRILREDFESSWGEADEATRQQAVSVREREEESESAPVRHGSADLQLPGGENYRELLLTLPATDAPLVYPEPLTELPEGYDLIVDRQAPAHGQWGITPPGQGHARFWAGAHASKEEATEAALLRLNGDLRRKAEEKHRGERTDADFTSGHYGDTPNVLAHVRFNERTDAEGRRVLFVEEIQSDWHQEGRKKGYGPPNLPEDGSLTVRKIRDPLKPDGHRFQVYDRQTFSVLTEGGTEREALDMWARSYQVEPGVPDAPFKRSWPTLALKRAIKWAADNGFDAVSWTTGAQQVERYETAFRAVVDEIKWEANRAYGGRHVVASKAGTSMMNVVSDDKGIITAAGAHGEFVGKPLEDLVGKSIAERILTEDSGTIAEEGITIGGKGMSDFYDKMLVNAANKLGKRFGVKVRRGAVPTALEDVERLHGGRYEVGGQVYETLKEADAAAQQAAAPVHTLPLTDDMRATAQQQGFSTFAPRYAGRVPRKPKTEREKRTARKKSKVERVADSIVNGFDKLPEEGLVDRVLRALQNRYRRIDKYMEALLTAGGLVTDDTHVREWITRLPGRIESRMKGFARRHQNRIRDHLKKHGITLADAGRYLYARHAPEANEHGMSVDPEGGWDADERPFSGLATSTANAEVEAFEQRAGFSELGPMVDAMNAETRKTLLEYGLISQEQYDAWEEMFDYYVPLRDPDKTDMAPEPRAKGFQVRGPETRSRGGRGEIPDPESTLVWSVTQGLGGIMRGEKNQIGQTFATLLHGNEGLAMFREGGVEEGMSEAELQALMDTSFTYKENGEEHRIILNDPLLARAMKDLGSEYPGLLLKTLAGLNRWLAAVNTALDPDFVLTNLARDLQTAAISVSGDKTGVKLLGTKIIKSVPRALKAAWALEHEKENATGKWADYARELESEGGLTGYAHLAPYEALAREMSKDLKRGAVGNALIGAKRWMYAASGAFETATRLSAYYHMREGGMPAKKAAVITKNMTVNFNDRGEMGVLLNSLYLFYNAGVQGSMRVMRSLKSRKVQGIAAGLVIGGAAMDLINRAMAPDDEDEKNLYDKVPEWVKQRNLIFWIPNAPIVKPGGLPLEDVHYVTIPMPYGYNVFHNIGRHSAAASVGAEPKTEALTGILSAAIDSFNPIGGGGSLAQTISPTFADPFVDIYGNRNWAGRPIAPEMPWAPDTMPESEKYGRNVAPLVQKATTWLNEIAGGDIHTSSGKFTDINPEYVEHVYEFFAGGIGRMGERLHKLANPDEGALREIRDVPILRRFVGAIPEWAVTSDFYAAIDHLEQARLRIRDGVERPGDEELAAMRNGVVIKGGQPTSLKEQLKELRDQRTPEADKEMYRLMRRFLRGYYEVADQ